MEKIDYGFYDSIDNTAARWLAWNLEGKDSIGFTCINGVDESNLWLLSIARHLYTYSEKPIYLDCNWIDYLWIKYILRFKFVKHYNKRKNNNVFLIDAIEFIKEIADNFKINEKTLEEIYDVYYRR